MLDQYFYHQNTAPFVSLRISQRFGLSNPSPRHIRSASLAFTKGIFRVNNNFMIGSGQYGDLKATTAAIIMDRDFRSVSLDSDPTYGSLREPLLRVLAIFRTLEYKQNVLQFSHQDFISPYLLETKIG